MAITLDPALDLLDSEDEVQVRRKEIVAKLQRSFEQSERGEMYSPDEARAILAKCRTVRAS